MINIIKKYINYVDENYHSDFTEEDIKNIKEYFEIDENLKLFKVDRFDK